MIERIWAVMVALSSLPLASLGAQQASAGQPHLIVNADQGTTTISRDIYGQFSEHLGHDIYGGYWIKDGHGGWRYNEAAIDALKKLEVPFVRWPGGCFADYYHWQDGIGPRGERPTMVNTVWGGVTEDNSFGTDEYLELMRRLGASPFIVGNVGSGTVKEMSDWWEYVNHPGGSPMSDLRAKNGHPDAYNVRLWGVGNESWGCGGNMTPEYYADEFKRYATFLRAYGRTQPYLIASGPNVDDYNWTDVMMRDAGQMMRALDFHYYTVVGTWQHKGSATSFTEGEWFTALQKAIHIRELIERHSTIMDRYDPDKRVALFVGEWGMWHDVEPGTNPGFLYQQNTMRDALVASASLDIFNNHADRVRMASIAQTINVLQSMLLTHGDTIVETPTYWVFQMYTVHHDATLLPISLDAGRYTYGDQSIPAVSASASRDSLGVTHITMSNLDPNQAHTVTTDIRGEPVSSVSGRILTAATMQAHNTFDNPHAVEPKSFDGARLSGRTLTVQLPPKSIVVLTLK